MLIDDVYKYCGDCVREINRKFGFSENSPRNWKRRGYIPIVSQLRIEYLSNGALKADLSHCKKVEDDPIRD